MHDPLAAHAQNHYRAYKPTCCIDRYLYLASCLQAIRQARHTPDTKRLQTRAPKPKPAALALLVPALVVTGRARSKARVDLRGGRTFLFRLNSAATATVTAIHNKAARKMTKDIGSGCYSSLQLPLSNVDVCAACSAVINTV